MKIGRRFQEETDAIPMTPLIDIVFLTLVFFMVTTAYGALESEIDILPTADSSIASERAGRSSSTSGRTAPSLTSARWTWTNWRVLRRVAEYFLRSSSGGRALVTAARWM